MADSSTPPRANSSDAVMRHGRGSPPSTPRWVKVFGTIVIVMVLLFVVLHLAGLGLGGHMHHMQ